MLRSMSSGAYGFKNPVSYKTGLSLFPKCIGFRATMSGYMSRALYMSIQQRRAVGAENSLHPGTTLISQATSPYFAQPTC